MLPTQEVKYPNQHDANHIRLLALARGELKDGDGLVEEGYVASHLPHIYEGMAREYSEVIGRLEFSIWQILSMH